MLRYALIKFVYSNSLSKRYRDNGDYYVDDDDNDENNDCD